MRIGIIGSGQIGGTLAHHLVRLGHSVQISNSRGHATLAKLAEETGAVASDVGDAVQKADLVIVTIPMKNVPELKPGIFCQLPDDVAVVDTCNYYPRERDGRIAEIEGGLPESQWVSTQIGRSVVKVFNNIFASHLMELGSPKGAAGRIALPVAGDHIAGKATVFELVDKLGFDPIDIGGLAQSWRQQPGTPVYCTDLDAAGVVQALAEARQERSESFSALPYSPGSFGNPA